MANKLPGDAKAWLETTLGVAGQLPVDEIIPRDRKIADILSGCQLS